MSQARDSRITVDGRAVRFRDQGEGSPVVLLNAGLGNWSYYWTLVQPAVAEFTRVVAFDRAGLGGSEPGDLPRDANLIVAELEAFLSAADIPPPYILVGHSLGGFHVRLFAYRHPERVAGVVFVDSRHEDMESPDPSGASPLARIGTALVAGINAATLSLARTPLARPFIHRRFRALPLDVRQELIQGLATRQHARVMQQETDARDANKKLIRETAAANAFPDVPVVAISAAGPQVQRLVQMSSRVLKRPFDELWEEEWLSLQRKNARLSPRGQHVLAHNSGHDIPLDEPHVVVAAIRQVFEDLPT